MFTDASAFTLGHTVFTRAGELSRRTLQHEFKHVRDYELLGDGFLTTYFGAGLVGALIECALEGELNGTCIHDSNILEKRAGPD